MIGNLPLWMVLAIWMLQRTNAPRLTIFNYPRWLRLIDDMRGSLPIPVGRMETRLVTAVLVRLDEEKAAILQLASIGVGASGVISKN